MEERRLLLAVVLSLAVVMAYTWLFAPSPPQPGAEAVAPAPSASLAPRVPAPEAPPERLAPTAERALVAPRAAGPAVSDEREHRVEVSAPGYVVAFSNRGARLVSWKLNRYRDARGRPEEMVPALSPSVRPLDIETGDAALDAALREALFRPSSDQVTVTGEEPVPLRFEYSDGVVEASKTIQFRARGLLAVEVEVRRHGQAVPCRLLWGPGIGNPSAEERSVQGYSEPEGVALVSGGVEKLAAGKLTAAGHPLQGARWVGVAGHYFAALFVPGPSAQAEIRGVTLPGRGDEKPLITVAAAVEMQPGVPVLLFVGAKDHQELAHLGHELTRVVQLGDWIGPIVLLLMNLLRWVHGHVGNWGWAIVLLTVVINVVMAPFRHYSIVNGLKMARVSPEMRVIQERYRKVPLMDPRRQQMQEEIGALYAKHGMSMGSSMFIGCLPILITMPFLIAFYRVLSVAVDLRGAPFLWISDLAQKDPLFITPVLMGVSMFVMQKMTPTAMDPAQQRIMMLMPLMFAGMFLWAPAGLNLYWFTSNLWSILQQGVSMRLLRPAPAAERAGRERRSR